MRSLYLSLCAACCIVGLHAPPLLGQTPGFVRPGMDNPNPSGTPNLSISPEGPGRTAPSKPVNPPQQPAQPAQNQPGYRQPGYSQPAHSQPAYPQSQPAYPQSGWKQPGHPPSHGWQGYYGNVYYVGNGMCRTREKYWIPGEWRTDYYGRRFWVEGRWEVRDVEYPCQQTISPPPATVVVVPPNPSGCYQGTMNDYSFAEAKNTISAGSFESTRLSIARQIIGNNCLYAEQVKQIMQLFWYESSKLEIAKFAYRNTVDKNMYFVVNQAFSFASSTRELDEFLANNR